MATTTCGNANFAVLIWFTKNQVLVFRCQFSEAFSCPLQPRRDLLLFGRRIVLGFLTRSLKVSQREFEAAVLGVIVILDGEGDVEIVAGEQAGLLTAFRHAPAQGIEGNGTAPFGVCRLTVVGGLAHVAASQSG